MPDRFAHVDKNIYRGGAPSKDDIDILKESWNIQKIVSLDEAVGNEIDAYCKQLGIEHVIIPLTDGNDKNWGLIPDEIKTWGNNYIYLHCLHGKDRTSAVIGIYRLLINHWPLREVLIECQEFKMGYGLSKRTKDSYYNTVINFSKSLPKDMASLDDADAVSIERDKQNYLNPGPGISNYTDNAFSQQSWAPFADVEIRSNIFSSRKNILTKISSDQNRLSILKKLAAPTVNIYKKCSLSDVLKENQAWYTSVTEAHKHDPKELKCFTASIPAATNTKIINQEPEPTLIHQAAIEGFEVVIFNSLYHSAVYLIINPSILENIHSIVANDKNNVSHIPMVGEFQDYTGSTMEPQNPSIPGGAGGVTGLIKLPGQIPYTEV